MYKHSMNAPEEMQQLYKQFYKYIETIFRVKFLFIRQILLEP